MQKIRICIDVEDMDKAVAFYTKGLGLTVGRRFDREWTELIGASCAIDLLTQKPGTPPFEQARSPRDYGRHWTPVHLDFEVPDIREAIRLAQAAGALLEEGPEEKSYGLWAQLSDPFGNGFCFLEFRGRGYDALLK